MEFAGLSAAGPVNAAAYLLWSGWLIALGMRILILAGQPARRPLTRLATEAVSP